MYRSMLVKLQYEIHSRPDIPLVVGIVARFLANPKENHLMEIKKILRYLKGTIDYGLFYKKGGNFELKTFIDADWARCVDDRKSTSGSAFFLGRRLVSWTTKKQNYVAQSIDEAKYVAIVINCTNVIWLKHLLFGMKEEVKEPVVIYCDNTSAINITKNLVSHIKSKHINIKYN